MSRIVTALGDEPLDALIWRETGGVAVEAVLAVNPGVAAHAIALPEGTPVLLPDIATAPVAVDLVQLWD